MLLQGRQRDVEDRVVEPDDDQAQRQDAEGLPAALMDEGSRHAAMVRSATLVESSGSLVPPPSPA